MKLKNGIHTLKAPERDTGRLSFRTRDPLEFDGEAIISAEGGAGSGAHPAAVQNPCEASLLLWTRPEEQVCSALVFDGGRMHAAPG